MDLIPLHMQTASLSILDALAVRRQFHERGLSLRVTYFGDELGREKDKKMKKKEKKKSISKNWTNG